MWQGTTARGGEVHSLKRAPEAEQQAGARRGGVVGGKFSVLLWCWSFHIPISALRPGALGPPWKKQPSAAVSYELFSAEVEAEALA